MMHSLKNNYLWCGIILHSTRNATQQTLGASTPLISSFTVKQSMGFSGFNFIPLLIDMDNRDIVRKSQEGVARCRFTDTLPGITDFSPATQILWLWGMTFGLRLGLLALVTFLFLPATPPSHSHVFKCPRHVGHISFKPSHIGKRQE